MNKHNNAFTYLYPSLDLHGETVDTMIVPLNSFIDDNIKLGNKKIMIIHGKGTGTLKKATHEYLKKDRRIKNYYLDNWNLGCTVVEIFLSIVSENVSKK